MFQISITLSIAIYYYHSAWKLTLILPSTEGRRSTWMAGWIPRFICWLTTYARNVFTVPLMRLRQIGQCDRDLEHISQHDKWPQGKKTVLISWSIQTRHVLASFSLRFSSSSCSGDSSLSNLSVLDAPGAAKVAIFAGILSSEAQQPTDDNSTTKTTLKQHFITTTLLQFQLNKQNAAKWRRISVNVCKR